jgi:lipid II:glycine glycyltransferase (peptidoglycan interpeptide bridge formation enzyme)
VLPLVKEDQPAPVEAVFRDAGFRASEARALPYRTIRIDLTPPLDEIRTQLAQKWRNALNGALRQGLSVSVHDDVDSIVRFAALFDPFMARKGFAVDLGPRVYARIQQTLPPDERLVLQLYEQDGELVSGHITSMLGETCVYLLGATNPDGLRARAAYLLQWNTIILAKGRGLHWYDLGGIDPADNPGVYHFKKGLGGEDMTTPGPFEIPPRGWRAPAVRSAEAVHRLLLRKGRRPTSPAVTIVESATPKERNGA